VLAEFHQAAQVALPHRSTGEDWKIMDIFGSMAISGTD